MTCIVFGINGTQPGAVPLGEEGNTEGIDGDPVGTRVRREGIEELNLVTLWSKVPILLPSEGTGGVASVAENQTVPLGDVTMS